MKNIKNLFFVVLLSFVLFTSNVFAKEKVKVYIFEAGGCPYCEAEVQYLEGLDSYNEKFIIVKKELYVDHVEWKEGKDYELGVKVAKAFNEKGFSQASYQGTPFVVISDLYAASAYSTSLESYIDKAYEEGDKDIVGCFMDGEECANQISSSTNVISSPSTDTKKEKSNNTTTVIVALVVVLAIGALLIITRNKNK